MGEDTEGRRRGGGERGDYYGMSVFVRLGGGGVR